MCKCRFSFIEGATSGGEIGNDHAQFAPSISKLEAAAAPAAAGEAAADGAEQQPTVEGGQLQMQLLEPDKSELQPLGLDVSFQEYIKSLMAAPAGLGSKDRVFLARNTGSSRGSGEGSSRGDAAADDSRLLQVLHGVAVANGLECKISCQNSKVRAWGAVRVGVCELGSRVALRGRVCGMVLSVPCMQSGNSAVSSTSVVRCRQWRHIACAAVCLVCFMRQVHDSSCATFAHAGQLYTTATEGSVSQQLLCVACSAVLFTGVVRAGHRRCNVQAAQQQAEAAAAASRPRQPCAQVAEMVGCALRSHGGGSRGSAGSSSRGASSRSSTCASCGSCVRYSSSCSSSWPCCASAAAAAAA